MTTGKGNPAFALTIAPLYDAMFAGMVRGKGTKIGALNQALVGAYTGGAGALVDSLKRHLAIVSRAHLMQGNGWMHKALGGTPNLEKFADWIEGRWDASTLALMDRSGMTSRTSWTAEDPSSTLSGIGDRAPQFVRGLADADVADTKRILANAPAHAQAFGNSMAQLRRAGINLNTLNLWRYYGELFTASNNGVRYSMMKANRAKFENMTPREKKKFISDNRRASGDPSRHGSNKHVNTLGGSLNAWFGIGMQSWAQMGRRFREDKVNFALNTTATVSKLVAMHYLAMYYDPYARKVDAAKTAAQRLMSITTFGGAEIPIETAARLPMALTVPLLDHAVGRDSKTGEMDRNFIEALEGMVGGTLPDMDEEDYETYEQMINEASRSNLPIAPLSPRIELSGEGKLKDISIAGVDDVSTIPGAIFIESLAGIDPNMSRLSGEARAPKEQKLSGMETEALPKPDSPITGYWNNVFRSIGGNAVAAALDVYDTAARAASDKEGKAQPRMMELIADQLVEATQKAAKPLRGLFGDRQLKQSAADVNFHLVNERKTGLDQLMTAYSKQYKTGGWTRGGVAGERLEVTTGAEESLKGTELYEIATHADVLRKQLRPNQNMIDRANRQIEAIEANKSMTQAEKNVLVNKEIKEKKYQQMQMLEDFRNFERRMSRRLGRSFTFRGLDPKEYMEPYPAKK